MIARAFAAFLLIAALAGGSASADPVAVSADVTINVLHGEHETGNGIERIGAAPLPLFAADARYRHTSLHAEALPGITFGYGNVDESTHLALLNLALRQQLGSSYLGIGQTLYNQTTSYETGNVFLVQGSVERQWSRVTGLRFEAGTAFALAPRTRFEVNLAVNPRMNGIEFSRVHDAFVNGTFVDVDLADPEHAEQVDMNIRVVRRTRGGEMIAGVRYLNYSSHYVAAGTPADGSLADRNAGIMPQIGYRFGR